MADPKELHQLKYLVELTGRILDARRVGIVKLIVFAVAASTGITGMALVVSPQPGMASGTSPMQPLYVFFIVVVTLVVIAVVWSWRSDR